MTADGPEAIERHRLRATFDEAAELYDRVRPRYPGSAIAELVRLAHIGPGSRVLEIGVGTAQLTVSLAELDCRIVGLEIGPNLAKVARRNLRGFPKATIEVDDFEEWSISEQPFDAVVSATAFHWLDPRTRVGKAADALRPGGSLAILGTHHVAGGSADFFDDVQACYESWDPTWTPELHPPAAAAAIATEIEEIERSARFGPVSVRRFEWDLSYTAAEYVELLLSYSGHRALAAEAQRGLFACITDLIATRYGGSIVKRYLTLLRVAPSLD
ncbi:MAG: class I SAM-dependent methyltransferase [Chloroflexi bacterium]|nr:class I SAM-dependent methyltransferase [Chloroflexota bacterium]